MMPLDPTNMPFQRAAPYRESEFPPPGALAGAAPDGDVETTLKAENILLEEFNYAGAAAYQAKEESGNLFNHYLLAAGALATGLGVLVNSYSDKAKLTVTLVETLVLAIGGVFSFAFFVRHLDLGQEYAESLVTMNVIKEFYIQRLKLRMPEIERAFSQRLGTIAQGGPLGRGATVMSFTVALLGSFAVAGAVGSGRQVWAIATSTNATYSAEIYVFGLGVPYFWEVLAAVFALLIHLGYYRFSQHTRDGRIERAARPGQWR